MHQKDYGTAGVNFFRNRERFIEGEDFFKISAKQFRKTYGYDTISEKTTNDVYLITESGYLMLVKSFTDDLAWTVQRELVKSYFREMEFRHRNNHEAYVDKTYRSKQCITKKEAYRILNLDREKADSFLLSHCVDVMDYEAVPKEAFLKENPQVEWTDKEKTIDVLYASGFRNLCRHFGINYLDQKYFLPAVTERQELDTRKKIMKKYNVKVNPIEEGFFALKNAKRFISTLSALLAMADHSEYYELPMWFFDELHKTAVKLEKECSRMYRWEESEDAYMKEEEVEEEDEDNA